MRKFLANPLPDTPENLMTRAGYERHCLEAGRTCYHRRFGDQAFPRFHAYVAVTENGMEVDLHFDQYSVNRDGNHDKPWAYEGGRVDGELRRIIEVIHGLRTIGRVNSPQNQPRPKNIQQKKNPKNFLDIFFK